MKNPYWLIKEIDGKYGIGTVGLDDAITESYAIEMFRASNPIAQGLHLTATLVTLRYEDGQPIVEPVHNSH
jgi:hypothetical protein